MLAYEGNSDPKEVIFDATTTRTKGSASTRSDEDQSEGAALAPLALPRFRVLSPASPEHLRHHVPSDCRSAHGTVLTSPAHPPGARNF